MSKDTAFGAVQALLSLSGFLKEKEENKFFSSVLVTIIYMKMRILITLVIQGIMSL